MDLRSQEAILRLAESHGRDDIVVIIGAPDPESAEIAAETVRLGDPTYAGPLAGAQLGLEVFHVLHEEVQADVPPEVWDSQIGVMADILDVDGINAAIEEIRSRPLDG
jgi:glycine reductase